MFPFTVPCQLVFLQNVNTRFVVGLPLFAALDVLRLLRMYVCIRVHNEYKPPMQNVVSGDGMCHNLAVCILDLPHNRPSLPPCRKTIHQESIACEGRLSTTERLAMA